MLPALLNPRRRSLIRANALVLLSLLCAALLSHFPRFDRNPFIALTILGVAAGTVDTVRCMQRRWSYYHAGVILCLYMDLLAITLALFFLLYPYFLWFNETH